MLGASQEVGASGRWDTIGNPAAIKLLSGAIDQARVSHAYLFVGPNRVGKRTLAIDFARALNCNASDVAASGWAESGTRGSLWTVLGLRSDIAVELCGCADHQCGDADFEGYRRGCRETTGDDRDRSD